MSDEDKLLAAIDAAKAATHVAEMDTTEDPITTEPEASTTEEDVKQPVNSEDVDDTGVPWKNRYKELERKTEKDRDSFQSQLEALNKKIEQANELDQSQALNLLGGQRFVNSQQPGQYPQAQAPQGSQAYQGYQATEDPDYQDPAQRPLTEGEYQRRELKKANDSATVQRFEEYLKRKDSPLYQEVVKRLQYKASIGADVMGDPFIASDTTAAAYGDLVRDGIIQPLSEDHKKTKELKRKELVDSSSLPGGGAPPPNQVSAKRMTDGQRKVADLFERRAGVKITEAEYVKRRNNIFEE